MKRGLKHMRLVYADHTKQAKIRVNWEHHYQRGEECWVIRNGDKVFGPFNFGYYTECGALLIWRDAEGFRSTFRAQFVRKDDVLYRSKEDVDAKLVSLKFMQLIAMKRDVDNLKDQIISLGGESYRNILAQVELCFGESK